MRFRKLSVSLRLAMRPPYRWKYTLTVCVRFRGHVSNSMRLVINPKGHDCTLNSAPKCTWAGCVREFESTRTRSERAAAPMRPRAFSNAARKAASFWANVWSRRRPVCETRIPKSTIAPS